MTTSLQSDVTRKRIREDADANVEVSHVTKRPKIKPSGSETKGQGVHGPLEGNDVDQGKELDDRLRTTSDSARKKSKETSRGKAHKAKGAAKDVVSSPGNIPLAKPSHKIRKLAPPRPFPTVPTSVSATGPKSQHKKGKNWICITRRTALGAYLRRCKELVMKDGYVRVEHTRRWG